MLRKLLDSPWTYAVPAVLLALGALFSLLDWRTSGRPSGGLDEFRSLRERGDVNLVFVVIDTLRADRLGSYGHDRPTSRFIDRLALGGIRFATVEAGSTWTKTSMASLWTGLDPAHTGITRFNHALPEAAAMPAETLQDAGFATIGVFRNSWVSPNFGFGQGFDAYLKPGGGTSVARVDRRPGAQLVGTDEGVTRSALAFLEASGHEKFFLYLHYMDVHQYAYDSVAADQGFGSTYRDSYDAAIHWVDRNIGSVLEGLVERDLLARTVVVVSSDHGEAFGEHGNEGHARDLYTEVTSVPWVISLPFELRSPVVVEPRVRNVDIWPTLLDMLGLPALTGTDGRSLVPEIEAAITGKPSSPSPPALSFLDRRWGRPEQDPVPLVAVRHAGRSLHLEPGAKHPVVGVFDIRVDPGELENLAVDGDSVPEWASELESLARQSLERPPPWGEAAEVEIDELDRAQLRALGYVIE